MADLNAKFLELTELSRKRPLIMGVLNITPDSFSDGGKFLQRGHALARAEEMLAQGADILDIGGESTRPGAEAVSLEEELKRVLPVIQDIQRGLPQARFSIDTMKAEVAERALDLGACMINDVSALRADAAMAGVAQKHGCGVVLMHRLTAAQTAAWSDKESSRYVTGVVPEVRKFLTSRASDLLFEGLDKKQFWIDPGFGFGKTVSDNLALIKGLPDFVATGYPVLLGTSRKSTLGAVLGGLPEGERLEATAATVALAAYAGVACLRVHDVLEMARVAKVAAAIKAAPMAKEAENPRQVHPFRHEEP